MYKRQIVECLNASNSGHEAKQYDLNIPNSYEIGDVKSVNGKYVSTVKAVSYTHLDVYKRQPSMEAVSKLKNF